MGQSTDAYLFYGFNLYDEEEAGEVPWGEEAYNKVMPDHIDKEGEWPLVMIRHYTGKDLPDHIKVDYHCCHNAKVWYVCVNKAFHVASRGYAVELSDEELKPDPYWYRQLKQFCEEAKIPWKEPGWVLASYADGF